MSRLARRAMPEKVAATARWLFCAWIVFAGAVALLHATLNPPLPGTPPWLVPAIAGIELISAAAFARRPNAWALAGLCSAFSGAIALHAMLGQRIVHLLGFTVCVLCLYAMPNRESRQAEKIGKGSNER